MALPFKDISYAQGLWNMDADTDLIVAMKASGFYTGSKLPYLDDQLIRNYADATRLGKVPILYHFAGGSDPHTEAAYFIAAIHPLAVGDIYALDWEVDVPDPVAWVLAFMTDVHNATGVWPLLYIDIDRLNSFEWGGVLTHCGLWVAAPSYAFTDTVPIKYPYIAQQGPIVNGVDTDMCFITLEEIKKYGYQAPTQVPVYTITTSAGTTSQTTTVSTTTPVATTVAASTPSPQPVPNQTNHQAQAIDVVVKTSPKKPVLQAPVVTKVGRLEVMWFYAWRILKDLLRGL